MENEDEVHAGDEELEFEDDEVDSKNDSLIAHADLEELEFEFQRESMEIQIAPSLESAGSGYPAIQRSGWL